ncbi:MAG: DUF2892 domain-containing protein [Dehalococcoidia bacterium]
MSRSITRSQGTVLNRFMASWKGRIARVALGAAISGTSLAALSGNERSLIVAVGLVPMAAGVFNLCLLAPLVGGHFFGSKDRAPRSGAERLARS